MKVLKLKKNFYVQCRIVNIERPKIVVWGKDECTGFNMIDILDVKIFLSTSLCELRSICFIRPVFKNFSHGIF